MREEYQMRKEKREKKQKERKYMRHDWGVCSFVVELNLQNTLRTPMSEASDDVRMAMALRFWPPESVWAYVFQCFCAQTVLGARCALKSLISTKRTCDFRISTCDFTNGKKGQIQNGFFLVSHAVTHSAIQSFSHSFSQSATESLNHSAIQ